MARTIKEDTVVNPDGTTTVVRRYYASLREELWTDLRQKWIAWVKESLQNQYPTDIDDFRARFDPQPVIVNYLLNKGYTMAQIQAVDPIIRDMFMLIFTLGLLSSMWVHGKPAGQPDADVDFEEELPLP